MPAPAALYPTAYAWFIFVSSMDLMLTWLVLELDGVEINPLADRIYGAAGMPGMVIFKFAAALLVIGACEIIGRRESRIGRRLAYIAVAIGAIPMCWTLPQLLMEALSA